MIKERILRWARARSPDFIIGGNEDPYLLRWWLIPRNPIFNIYVHMFLRSDDDRALHTHPWLFNLSWLLAGKYREWTREQGDDWDTPTDRSAGAVKVRWGSAAHRIELTEGACWTLFVTGPRVRQWGFLCLRGFVHWQDFTDGRDKGSVGKGCNQ